VAVGARPGGVGKRHGAARARRAGD
jgi:hypothetical protein